MAAGVTYEPIATSTSSGNNSGVGFSGFSSSYTDLVLTIYSKMNSGVNEYTIQFNGDSGQSYSYTRLYYKSTLPGLGGSSSSANYNAANIGEASNSYWGTITINIPNYSNTTTYKTVLTRASAGADVTSIAASLWSSTAAITSIYISLSSGSFIDGSTFTLYGIKAA